MEADTQEREPEGLNPGPPGPESPTQKPSHPREAPGNASASKDTRPPWLRPKAWSRPPTPTTSRFIASHRTGRGRGQGKRMTPNIAYPKDEITIEAGLLMEEILPILRGLERSWRLARTIEQGLVTRDGDSDLLHDGQLQLTQSLRGLWSRLQDMLERYDLTLLNPMGKPFDPRTSKALTVKGGTGKPEGTVVGVIAYGYTHRERILAQAEVIIAAEA